MMEYRKFNNIEEKVSAMALGTWVFGGGKWWGNQKDSDSMAVMQKAIDEGINLFDTAPFYGNGRSEQLVGKFISSKKLRKKIVLATKLGLDPESPTFHNLKRDRMLREMDESLRRLATDYIDIYQIHFPDSDVPIKDSAKVMRDFYGQGLIKAVGVSNYSVEQMKEFMEYCPLHSLQPRYNMFSREIEKEILPFCIEKGISTLGYSPLHGGILTGKFFQLSAVIPDDMRRKRMKDLVEPAYSVNKKIFSEIEKVASDSGLTPAQFVLNWTMNRPGITCILAGARTAEQLEDDLGACGVNISKDNIEKTDRLLDNRIK
ncbi:MAG: aldo/keto reductase [Elusimicrobiota bacterium]|nr:aldo/keto reductase [Elusimicrobiota bacterium]